MQIITYKHSVCFFFPSLIRIYENMYISVQNANLNTNVRISRISFTNILNATNMRIYTISKLI